MTDVSVVIPTFRRPALLVEAIRSALLQRDASIEILVIDDSPEGSARSVVEQCGDTRVRYLQCTPPSNGKPALVRNLGWRHATGRIVHFLDDDDRVAPGFHRAALEAFQRNPEAGVVFGNIEPFSARDGKSMDHERQYFSAARRRAGLAGFLRSRRWLAANLLFMQTLLVNSACLIRRECISDLGGYNTEISLNEDVDFYCRAIRRFGFRYLNRVAVEYRIQPDSLIHGRSDNQRLVESYRLMYVHYRATHGTLELFVLKLLARTILRFF